MPANQAGWWDSWNPKNPVPTFKTLGRAENNSMTLLIAPHPSSSSRVSGTQDKPFSPHSRRSGANIMWRTPRLPLFPHLAYRLQNPCRLVPRLHYSATPASLSHSPQSPLLGWEYWKLTLQTPQPSLHPKTNVFVAQLKNMFLFLNFWVNLGLSLHA